MCKKKIDEIVSVKHCITCRGPNKVLKTKSKIKTLYIADVNLSFWSLYRLSRILSMASYPSIFTNAGIPPDLKMANRPSLWWDRLWRVPAVQRAVSTSFVFCMVLTMADTIWGERMMAWRDASFLDSWCTITAALFTTT